MGKVESRRTMQYIYDVIVVGGGPAGLMAAGTAAGQGKKVLLLEKNNSLGRKLLITGKGRCNLTNNTDQEGLLANIPGNPSFLYSAFYTFGSQELISFFEGLGVNLKTERGNRVFPASDKALDIVQALVRYVKKQKADIRLNEPVSEIKLLPEDIKEVVASSGRSYKCRKLILATGGLSYPGTGSTGDGYKFARNMGHKVTKLSPSLVPLKTQESWVHELQGLGLKNVGVKVSLGGKLLYQDFGEVMFTHYGISGPVTLSASRYLTDCFNKSEAEPAIFSIDLKPALDHSALDKRLIRDLEKYKNKDFQNSLNDLLPQKMIPVIVELSGIPAEKKSNSVTKEERRNLGMILKELKFHITGPVGFNEAVITVGGVSVDEIKPGSMESKLVPGLYLAGELLDVDGYTGGFNLQIAFSTGYLAGMLY